MTYLKLDSKCIHLLNWSCVWKNFSQSLKISKTRNLSLEIVSKENSQQKTTADCFLVNLDFQACLHSFMLKLYYFRLTQIIKDQLNLDYELLSLDFDVVIEGVNCRICMSALLKLQSLNTNVHSVISQCIDRSSMLISSSMLSFYSNPESR